jgi:EAL domain-containing protein (putative c-di-GMP-specific phosphodiesterase class I)
MLEALQPPLQLDERTLVISASIGITSLTGESGDDALQAADLALYRAKAAGKSQFARFSDDLRAHAQRQLYLGSALAMGLGDDAFVIHYQPICSIDGGQMHITGVEALLRWSHEGRLVSPQEFIPILEEAGSIVAVGEWVLRETCRETRAWQLAGHSELRCSVNLSSRQLQQSDFAGRLVDILTETGLPPASLILEITESLLMEDTADVLASIREIARLGVKLALDDFGTGYCSLGYLKRFPLYALKVDRSFIAGAATDPELAVISRAIIGLGHNLGLAVIAEGVETVEQIEFLRAEGCSRAQGYWFSKPRPAGDIGRLLRGETCFEGQVVPVPAAVCTMASRT